jgi:glycosyltransferase involved in cell wall biosynthesis
MAPFGVFPPRNGGHTAVLDPARALARGGVDVHLFGLGIRRFEVLRHGRSFVRELEPRLVEERLVSWWNFADYARRGRSGLPPLAAAQCLERRASALLQRRMSEADVVQYELPWLFGFAPAQKPTVFVAHNAEAALLEGNARVSADALRRASALEAEAWRRAGLVVCLTEEDRESLGRRYGPREAFVVPLGVDVERMRPPDPVEREAAREALGVEDRFVVLFTGSWHLPNRAALARMEEWARSMEHGFLFVAAGSVGKRRRRGESLVVTGPMRDLGPWFRAADCCVNPLDEGSGANVKLLEYLAMGLPVVTTGFGSRGLDLVDGEHALVRSVAGFPGALRDLRADPGMRSRIGRRGRELVVATQSWQEIAMRRRALLDSLV